MKKKQASRDFTIGRREYATTHVKKGEDDNTCVEIPVLFVCAWDPEKSWRRTFVASCVSCRLVHVKKTKRIREPISFHTSHISLSVEIACSLQECDRTERGDEVWHALSLQ